MTRWELQQITVHIQGAVFMLNERSEFKIKKEEIHSYESRPGWSVDEQSKKVTAPSGWEDVQKLAAEGWELVSVTGINGHGIGDWSQTNDLLFVFKRPIEEVVKETKGG